MADASNNVPASATSPSPSSSSASIVRNNKTIGTPLNPDDATRMLNEEYITRLTDDAIRKLAAYTRNELQATTEECQLLEAMNKTTKEKYAQMSQMSQRLMDEMTRLQGTYADFATFMAQVDDIHQQAVEIEKVAHALDEYSRHLENKLAKKTNTMATTTTRGTSS
ncbi:predicted protein [Lichtheimia corymbifera JMRC:FSU:9682]|uniref:Biogenesis of lysosome-related organelles complex 1 subunit 2 n=1 Tax=Lichtheimia corymbifera JMRC:FSU:9682 TaxID=1263082 RepID=A0A068RSU2_9FUNG|nr:predicted protein [Lichtheimia corymbifera JMRC:FSU:9682]